jgi:DNA-directed RNA polymerase sigma subunit (sigma70/sigma32)
MIQPRYLDYKPMVIRTAKLFNRKTGIDLEELISEGNVEFCKALKEWDSKKGSFSTFLWIKLDRHLNNFCKSRMFNGRNKIIPVDDINLIARMDKHLIIEDVANSYMFKDKINKLSKEARLIISMILNPPKEMEEDIQKHPLSFLSEYLRKELGWTWSMIRCSFKEIRECLK